MKKDCWSKVVDRVDLVSEQRKIVATRIAKEFVSNRVIRVVKLDKFFRRLKQIEPAMKKSVRLGSVEPIRCRKTSKTPPMLEGYKPER